VGPELDLVPTGLPLGNEGRERVALWDFFIGKDGRARASPVRRTRTMERMGSVNRMLSDVGGIGIKRVEGEVSG
jgi:hypothetical protein